MNLDLSEYLQYPNLNISDLKSTFQTHIFFFVISVASASIATVNHPANDTILLCPIVSHGLVFWRLHIK